MSNGKPGRAPEEAKRALFIELISAGATIADAGRQVGVNYRTARRWVKGRTVRHPSGQTRHYEAVITVKPVVSGRYLSQEERIVIADLRRAGTPIRAIAAKLQRSPSTISRELHRNTISGRGYRPYEADRLAALRRARPGRGKLRADPDLAQCVQEHLDKRWSPAQISHTLRTMFPASPNRHLAPETIYQAIYRTGSGVRRPHRRPWLRTGRRYRRRRIPAAYRPRRLVDMVSIDHRPNIVDRVEPGHWEGDLIMGVGNRSAIGTLVERHSRYTILLHLDGRRSAETVRDAVITAFSALAPHLRRSLTWDQGNEMAYHQHISIALSMPVYFCHPRSPWQRPTNEHTNGLLRQYFPKRTDLAQHTDLHLAVVANELNTRPRKVLNWDTPANRFATIANTPVLQP
jgi:transposase, IS30 family